ncbi:proteasome complex subunit Rpn13 ubiquitin receptor-domain-containing protein [Lipomyces oligophaga]|uniref:proteasome complex subunit Rpn13 ubiquitin receptor-domain-containing protein n=1 Tax=Lipomyces oligophaga TaxID=45792 RepID=UPI0034CEDE8E
MSDSVVLLTFKAGRVDFNPPSKHVKPLPQKGKITLSRSTDEDALLLSFVWEPRGSSKNDPSVEKDELMIFPGEAEWLPVSQCKSGRMFVLKFNSSNQRSFFWMQDPPASDNLDEITETDLKISTRINTLLEDIDAEDVDISEDPEDLKQVASTAADVEMADAPASSSGGNEPAPQSSLSSLISSIVVPPASHESQSTSDISEISDAITPQRMASYVDSLADSDPKLASLYHYLPLEIPKTKRELIRVLQSPQFIQGLNSLSLTLRSAEDANVGHLVASELGLPYRGEGVEGFLRALFAAAHSTDQEEQNENQT